MQEALTSVGHRWKGDLFPPLGIDGSKVLDLRQKCRICLHEVYTASKTLLHVYSRVRHS